MIIKKISEKYKISETLAKGLLIALVFIIMIAFILLTGNKRKDIKKSISFTQDDLIKLLEKIHDNYTLDIDETIDGETTKLLYSTDSKIDSYELNNKVYLYYNNNLYEINQDNYKLTKTETKKFVNNPYYNINLLKNVFGYCELKYINNVKSTCVIHFNDYIREYNLIYKKNIENINIDIKFDIIHFGDKITKINVDYSNINKYINFENKDIKYGIRISDIDNNNFDEFLDYYKKELNK